MQGSINFDGSLVGNITGGGGGGGDTVVITPVVTSGTKIADVSVNGVEKDLYCPNPPTPPEIDITPVVTSGTKIADVSIGGVEKDLYSPDYGADITALDGRLDTAEDNITSLTGRVVTAEGNIEDVINQIDGITIYKQILNQDIVSFSAGNSMPIMKLVANISNVTGCIEENITVCGTNIWDEEWELDATYRLSSKNYIPVKPNTEYIFCNTYLYGITGYDKDKNSVGRISVRQVPNVGYKFTTSSNCYFIKFNVGGSYGPTYNNNISINYPSTDTEYHAYNGHTYNIPFVVGGNTITIYNGTYDLISGVLIDNDNSTTYQLPATPIDDLQGQNNIWSDTGSIANVGYLDILNIS